MAIHLNSRGFAFVVFEGELAPLDWSIVEARGGQKREKILARVGSLFARYLPNVVVLENMSDANTRRPERIRHLNKAIEQLASGHSLPVMSFTRSDVREQFAAVGTVTKEAIAHAIAKHIPAFERFLPRRRKAWESEDPRMGIFDAAALVLVFFYKRSVAGSSP
jgi:Holliday junction resolvasome RuvABC endonuclease subunit